MPQANPPAPVFALAPGMNNNAMLNYSASNDIKHYSKGVAKLEDRYTGKQDDLKGFLDMFLNKARSMGWLTLFTIPCTNATGQVIPRNLLTEYGQITLSQAQDYASTYLGQQLRSAQDSYMAYNCLFNSVEPDFLKKLSPKYADYHVAPNAGGTPLPDDPTFLEVIIMQAHVDTRATASRFREELSSLDNYMLSMVTCNIEDFNLYVDSKVLALNARGETTTDLIVNLFKGYKRATDPEFVKYMRDKKDKYNEGADINAEGLMSIALNKYHTMQDNHEWNAPSPEQEQIIALSAKLERLEKASKEKTIPKKKVGKAGKPNGKPTGQGDCPPLEDWQLVAPGPNEPLTKTVDGKCFTGAPSTRLGTNTRWRPVMPTSAA